MDYGKDIGTIIGGANTPKAEQDPAFLRATKANEQAMMAGSKPVTTEPAYIVTLTRSAIRRLAKLSPDADRKLRQQAPAAFIGEAVPQYLDPMLVMRFLADDKSGNDGDLCVDSSGRRTIYSETDGPYSGRGLHLDSYYTWEIVSRPYGSTLVARERV